MTGHADDFVDLRGSRLRILRGGEGPPLLFLHGASGLGGWLPFMARLSKRFSVIAPEHFGFGRSDDPPWLDTVHDLAYGYLDLLDALDLSGVHLVGTSLGAWTAAEMAVRSTDRLASLTLICAVGILDDAGHPIDDVARLAPEEHVRRFFHDDALRAQRLTEMRTGDKDTMARNRATVVRLGWRPRFHDPDLHKWLHRIDKPTLVLWGREDGIVPLRFGEAFQRRIPGAKLAVLDRAGHAPFIERPDAFCDAFEGFVDALTSG